jgi:hypothetical protein
LVLTFWFLTFQFWSFRFSLQGAFYCVTSSTTDHEKKNANLEKTDKMKFSLFFHENNGSKKLSQKLLWLLEIIVLASITYFYW